MTPSSICKSKHKGKWGRRRRGGGTSQQGGCKELLGALDKQLPLWTLVLLCMYSIMFWLFAKSKQEGLCKDLIALQAAAWTTLWAESGLLFSTATLNITRRGGGGNAKYNQRSSLTLSAFICTMQFLCAPYYIALDLLALIALANYVKSWALLGSSRSSIQEVQCACNYPPILEGEAKGDGGGPAKVRAHVCC